MIRKRLLSACLALALCLGLLPVTALAVDTAPQTLYVGSTTITAGYWTSSDDGTNWTSPQEEPTGDSYIYYDGQGTLKLHNATIQGGSNTGSAPFGSGIYALSSSGQPVALTIELIGTNTITGTFGIFLNAEIDASSYGTNATLTITGENNGSLEVSGSNHGIFVISGTGKASLTINDASVVAKTTQTYSGCAGVCVQSGASATNSPNISLSVDGGSLTASGTGSNDGILFYVGQSQATGATTSLTVSENAIVDARNGGIKALKISETLPTPTPTGDNRSGIVFDGSTGTVYGTVALQNDLAINEGETLTIPEGSSLDMGGNEITVASGGKLEGTPTGSGTVKIAPTITTESLPDGEVGTAYSQTLVATGDPTITWNVTSDTLPAGLTLDTKTGTISGTPTTANTYNFTVTATNDSGNDSKEFTLTIDQQGTIHVTSVSLDKTSLELTEGGTGTLIATVEPNNATNRNVTWESSNTSVATVDANGLVTAVSAGTATITATAEDGRKTATCTVTVKPAEYTVTVLADGNGSASASPATAEAGTTVTLTADPDNGWRFSRWEVVEGDVTITGNRFIMPAENVTVRAVFSPIVNIPDTYDIDLIVGEGGEAKLSLTNASEGSTITVTATPDAGYELDYITVDGERIDGTTFTMPNHDVTVRVYFTDDAALPFTDVSAGAWYFDAVGYVYVGGLMDGVSDTLFDPDGTMTRAMVWAILARVDGETVTGEDWIETARDWAVAEGVSDGENATDYVTREQFATMLWRYASGKGYDVSIGEDTNILSYADFADLSEYAIPAMQWACGAGVITGVTDATLVPQGEATRAQVAAMLMRFVEAIG